MALTSVLDRGHTIAKPGFNRWMVPPAALCIHLCIGQVYAFSVFNLPMSKLIGIAKSAPDDWKLTELGWIFSIAIFVLGFSAAVLGRWVEEGGPRRAMFAAALCFGGGFLVSAFGVSRPSALDRLSRLWRARRRRPGTWLHFAGVDLDQVVSRPARYGDRHGDHGLRRRCDDRLPPVGMAHERVLDADACRGRRRPLWSSGSSMLSSCWSDRRSCACRRQGGSLRATWPPAQPKKLITTRDVYVYQALKTPQFWLIWIVLCMNVTAGIGVLGQASAMSQEMFPGRVTAAAAGGFVGLLSIFNMAGRFFWASTSDFIGRKNTYFVFFALGFVLYALVPYFGGHGNLPLFILCFLIIISMYGGGFATVPAYLKDMFGTRYVGAIHGWLITAWSAAGVLGPVLVNYIRQYQIDSGVPKAQAYNVTMYIMAGLLVVGFIANFLIQAVDDRHHMELETVDEAVGVA